MKKKIFSALLMGVFTLASMSMFVSCKDYDDDINNLDAEQQTLKSDLETLKKDVDAKYTDLSGQLSTALQNAQEALSSAQDAQALIAEVQTTAEEAGKAAAAAQTTADNAQDAAEAAQKTAEDALEAAKKALEAIGADESGVSLVEKVADLSERVGNLETLAAGIPELIAKLDEAATKEELDEVKADVKKYQDYFDSIFAMVTSVSLYSSQGLANNLDLTFNQVTEKENKFPAEASVADNQFTFTKDFIRTYDDEVVVRVSPTNATLTAENITLINSQGVELTDLVECTNVERYEGLLSRAATTGNGLWTVTFKLKDGYNPDDFAAATTTEDKEAVLFAVAVKNTDYNDVDRRVISSYDLTVKGEDAGIAANTFDVQGNDGVWRNIDNANSGKGVKNRYLTAEDGTSTKNIEELAWLKDDEPGTVAILKGQGVNAKGRVGVNPDPETDNRNNGSLLPAEVDKAINIRIDWDAKNDKARKDIKGFYVTLDKNFAVESVPSELNAWNSYTYENVGTDKQAAHLFEGNTGSITIKDMGNVVGDVIGFRVYAVNLDGTLLDPDGRAFYVAVGNTSTEATVPGEIIATNQYGSKSELIPVSEGTFISYDGMDWGWTPDEKNPIVDGGKVEDTEFTVLYFKADGKTQITAAKDFKDIRYVQFVMPNALNFVDGATYTQTLKLYNKVSGKDVLAKTITAVMTKKLPTAFPATFAIKEGQNIGNNTIRPFIVPENGWAVTPKATEGKADLKDLLYMMTGSPLAFDQNYSFNFLTSAADADEDGTDDAVAVKYDPAAGGYFLPIADDFIDDETVHAVEVSYLYQNVSAYKKADGKWYIGAHAVDYDNTLNAQYACWHHDMSWAWYTTKENKAVNTTLTWTNPGATSTLQAGWIKISSSRDAEFAGSLYSLISGKKYVEVVNGSAKLTTESGQVSPYFVPTIDTNTGDITCTQNNNQDAQAPYHNHTETLSFKVKDVYDHEITISLPVQIVNPVLPTE